MQGEDARVRRAEIYSKISMKFLGGSAHTRRTIMHARMLIDTWVERRLARTRCTSGERDLSLCIPFTGGRHYFTYCRRRRTATAFANFSSTAKRNGRQFGRAGRTCARVYTVTLTLLLQFNAFHREAGAPGFEDTSSRTHSADRTTTPQVLSNLWCSGNIYFSAYNGAAETRNRICKRIYIDARPVTGTYRAEIFCSRADD